MRVAHCTDIHFTEDVPLGRLWGKRILGTANQVLRGRRHHFPDAVQADLVAHLLEQAPDLLVITGDLTAQALDGEFDKALRVLRPALEAQPTIVMPGNHDVYTRGARDADRIAQTFGPWLHRDGPIGKITVGCVDVVTLDPNRPTFIHASGEIPAAQLDALRAYLEEPSDNALILGLHYPVVDRHGEVYDGVHRGLLNARALLDVLGSAPRKPDLVIHGHEHHGYRQHIELGSDTLLTVDCGSSGYKHMPGKKRAAAMCIYDIEPGSVEIARFLHDGEHFVPEPGGAFATGR